MKTAGIIAEFNPFHTGHQYLIEQTRAAGATHIVAVMSGSFVQRGEPALFSKWERTQAALKNGVDLVIELPVIYALSSAERFADGAVRLLNALGCVDLLSFGSECGDAGALARAAIACLRADKTGGLKPYLKAGLPYPAACQHALAKEEDSLAALLSSPNNTLAIAYLKAAFRQQACFTSFTVKRIGAAHDGLPAHGYASASFLRQEIKAERNIDRYLPPNTIEELQNAAIAEASRLDTTILWKLRRMKPLDFKALPDVSEGLENRLYDAARTAESVENFLSAVKTKRYPHARLRRIIWYAILEMQKSDRNLLPSCLRVLGFNTRGRELMQAAKRSGALPLVGRFTELEAISPRIAELEQKATDLRALALAPPAPCGMDYTKKMIITDRE